MTNQGGWTGNGDFGTGRSSASPLAAEPRRSSSISTAPTAVPCGNLTLSGTTLYGMASGGGTIGDYGTIFSEPVAGGTPTVLYNFDSDPRVMPVRQFALSGSTLYGMTSSGGTNGFGTIFSEPLAAERRPSFSISTRPTATRWVA